MTVIKLAKELDFEAIKYSCLWAYPKTIEKLTDRSSSGRARVTKRFEEFVETYPKYFEPYFYAEQAILNFDGETTQYNLICFIHYYQNRDLLDVGIPPKRSFKDDIKYIKEWLKDETN